MTTNKPESSQADKFKELARDLECDEDEAKFEETVKKVATPTLSPDDPPKD